MLPRIVLVLGLTAGIMGPLIWAGYALLPAPHTVSSEGQIRTGLPDKQNFESHQTYPRGAPPVGNVARSQLRRAEPSTSPSAPSSQGAETEAAIKRALPGPNAIRQRTPSANAISAEGSTPPADGITTGSAYHAKTITTFTTDRTRPSSTAKPQEAPQDQRQEPMTADPGIVATIPLSAENKAEVPTRKSPAAINSSRANNLDAVGVYRVPKKKRLSLDGSVPTADKRFCGFGSYVACTHGLCRQFCY
jgi:hypothetical protein